MKTFFHSFLLLVVCLFCACASESLNVPSEEVNPEYGYPSDTLTVDTYPTDSIPSEEVLGLDAPVTEVTDEYSIEYQYVKEAVVLPPAVHSFVTYGENETDSVVFIDAAIPDNYLPEAGDILTAEMSDYLPDGLGCRVVSVTEEDGRYKVVTEPAALDEIFCVLNIDATFYEVNDEYGDDESRASGFYEIVNIDVSTKDDGKFMQSNLYGGINYTLHINLEQKEYEIAAGFYGGYKGKSGVKVKGNAELVWAKWPAKKPTARKKAKKIGPLAVFTANSGTLKSVFSGELEASLAFDFSFDVQGGVSNGHTFGKGEINGFDNYTLRDNIKWEGEGSVTLVAEVNCGMSFFTGHSLDVITPSVEVRADAKIDLDNLDLFKNGSMLGLETKAGIGVADVMEDLLGKSFKTDIDIPEYKVDIWSKSFDLFPKFDYMTDEFTIIDNPNRLVIEKSFHLHGGWLCKYMEMKPVLMVYDGDELYNVYYNDDVITDKSEITTGFEMDINVYDRELTLRPGIEINGRCYPTDGSPLYIPSPDVKVTGINQTRATYNEGAKTEEDRIYQIEFDITLSMKDVHFLRSLGIYSGGEATVTKSFDVPDKDGEYTVGAWIKGPKKTFTVAYGTFFTRKGQDEVTNTPLYYKTLNVGGTRSAEEPSTDVTEAQLNIDWSTLKRIK